MAEGALTRSPVTMAVAVTGVLGPEEDEDGNPVAWSTWQTPYTVNRPELMPTASRQGKSKAIDLDRRYRKLFRIR